MQNTRSDRRSEEILEEIRALLVRSVELQASAIDLERERGEATDSIAANSETETALARQRTGLSEEQTALVRAQTRFSTRTTELAEVRTDLALERNRLATERNDLAALRTDLARGRNVLAHQRNDMAEARTRLAETRTQLSTLVTTYAKSRTELARVRTELSVVRTGAALATLAVALWRFFPTGEWWWYISLAVMGIGGAITLGIGLALYEHSRRLVRHLDRVTQGQESELPFLERLLRH